MHERGPEVDFSFLQLSFLGLEQLVSKQAKTLVLVGDRAYRVLVTEFIFNECGFVTLVSQLKKKRRKTCPVHGYSQV